MTNTKLIKLLEATKKGTEVLISIDGTYFKIESVTHDPDVPKSERLVLVHGVEFGPWLLSESEVTK